MPWKLVRLEHAETGEFPAGSPIRAYILHLPLGTNGHIDPESHAENPHRATMRRFWPSEQDLSGYIVRDQKGWKLVSSNGGATGEAIGWIDDSGLVVGRTVEIIEADRASIPFRVAEIRPD